MIFIRGGMQEHQTWQKDVSPCLTEAMGMGGGHIPIIMEIEGEEIETNYDILHQSNKGQIRTDKGYGIFGARTRRENRHKRKDHIQGIGKVEERRKMPMADGGNRRIIDMVEVAESFFRGGKIPPREVIAENEYRRESAIIQLRLFDMDVKLRELSEKVEELKSQIAEVGK